MLDAAFKPGESVGRGFAAWGQSFGVLSLIGFAFGVPAVIAADALQSALDTAGLGVAATLCAVAACLVGGVAAPRVFDGLDGAPPPPREMMGLALRALPGLLFASVVLGVIAALAFWGPALAETVWSNLPAHRRTVLAAFIVATALIVEALLLPGLCMAPQAAVVEGLGPFAAFRRSLELTRKHRFSVFGAGLWSALILGGLGLAVLLPARFLEEEVARGLADPTRLAGWVAVAVVCGGLYAGTVGAVYRDLRVVREGYGLKALVKIFE